MGFRTMSSSKPAANSSLLFVVVLLAAAATKLANAVDPNAFPYDFTVLQRLGETYYTDLPVRIFETIRIDRRVYSREYLDDGCWRFRE
jgi:hypothetical protein